MKKIEIKEFGGPEVLEVKNVDIGKPSHNEVLVKNLSIFPSSLAISLTNFEEII